MWEGGSVGRVGAWNFHIRVLGSGQLLVGTQAQGFLSSRVASEARNLGLCCETSCVLKC